MKGFTLVEILFIFTTMGVMMLGIEKVINAFCDSPFFGILLF